MVLMQLHFTKCDVKLSYPSSFDIKPFCTKDVLCNGYKGTWYSLTAAILHHGNGAGGHYTCFHKVAPGEYLHYDDAWPVQCKHLPVTNEWPCCACMCVTLDAML